MGTRQGALRCSGGCRGAARADAARCRRAAPRRADLQCLLPRRRPRADGGPRSRDAMLPRVLPQLHQGLDCRATGGGGARALPPVQGLCGAAAGVGTATSSSSRSCSSNRNSGKRRAAAVAGAPVAQPAAQLICSPLCAKTIPQGRISGLRYDIRSDLEFREESYPPTPPPQHDEHRPRRASGGEPRSGGRGEGRRSGGGGDGQGAHGAGGGSRPRPYYFRMQAHLLSRCGLLRFERTGGL